MINHTDLKDKCDVIIGGDFKSDLESPPVVTK